MCYNDVLPNIALMQLLKNDKFLASPNSFRPRAALALAVVQEGGSDWGSSLKEAASKEKWKRRYQNYILRYKNSVPLCAFFVISVVKFNHKEHWDKLFGKIDYWDSLFL